MLDSQATSVAVAQIAQEAIGLDIVINATSFIHNQGKEILELDLMSLSGE